MVGNAFIIAIFEREKTAEENWPSVSLSGML